MRYSASAKYEILPRVEQASLSVRQTLNRLAIHHATYYNWLKRYYDGGVDALEDNSPHPVAVWNRLPDQPRLHPDAGFRPVPTSQPSSQRPVADRFYLLCAQPLKVSLMMLTKLEHVWNASKLYKDAINQMPAFCYEKA